MVGVGAYRRDAVGTETGAAPATAGSSHPTLAVAVPYTGSGNVGKAAAAGVGLGGSEGLELMLGRIVKTDSNEEFLLTLNKDV